MEYSRSPLVTQLFDAWLLCVEATCCVRLSRKYDRTEPVGRLLLQRFAERLKHQKWGTVSVEFGVVVFGVFAGLQAQEWYEFRSEREAEKEYVARLNTDFTAIQVEVEQCLSVYRGGIEAISAIANTLDSDTADGQPAPEYASDFGNVLLKATAGVPPPGRSVTFVEMLSTGDLSLLKDKELRRALTAYDQLAEVNRETWRSLREIQDRYVAPLYENIKLSVDPDAQQVSTVTEYSLSGIADDPRAVGMVNVLAGSKSNNYELCRMQAKRVAAVQQALARDT